MASDQIEINIYLKEGAENEVGGSIAGTTAPKENNIDKKRKQLLQYISSQTIGTFINNTKSNISTNIGLITGKKQLQEKVNFVMDSIQMGSSFYSNAASTATIVAEMGGSALAGGLIGAALTAVNYGINLAFKVSNMNISESLENRQIRYINSRYGANYNNSRGGRL